MSHAAAGEPRTLGGKTHSTGFLFLRMISEHKSCPRCRLESPNSAIWCDCGHVFDFRAAKEMAEKAKIGDVDRPVEGSLICSKCGSLSRPSAETCRCGYRFVRQQVAEAPRTAHDTMAASRPLFTSRRFSGFAISRVLAAGLLLLGLGDLEYGYYTLLRWVVSAVAFYTASVFLKTRDTGWTWVFAVVGLMFNPIFPVELGRAAWALVDIAVAAFMLVSIKMLPVEPASQ
jgi:ribosomal protein L40E